MYLLKANDNFVAPAMDRFRTFEEPAIALMLLSAFLNRSRSFRESG